MHESNEDGEIIDALIKRVKEALIRLDELEKKLEKIESELYGD